MNKKIKCEECGEPIVSEDKVKYAKTKRVCDRCFYRIKREGGNLGRNKTPVESVYQRWLNGGSFY